MGATAAVVGAVGTAASAANSIAKGAGGGGGGDGTDQYTQLLRQQMLQNYGQLAMPDLSGQQNTAPYGTQSWLRDYTPETYAPWIGEVTQMSDDPAMRDQQMQSLAQLGQFAKGGLLPTDTAALARVQQQQAGATTSQAEAAADQLRQRGLAGAGSEMAARLQAVQQGAEGSYNLYNQALADALSRQTQAVTQQGQLATNVRGQEAQISQAMADINNQFNTQVQGLRTAAAANAAQTRNAAQQFNITGQQQVANNNVQTQNANLDLFRQVAQQGYQNQLTKLQGMSGAVNSQVSDLQAAQAANAQRQYGASQSVNTGLNTLGSLAKQAGQTNWFGLGGGNSGNTINAWSSSHANDPDYQGVV